MHSLHSCALGSCVCVCALAPAVRQSLQIVGKTDFGEGKEGLLIARILVDGSFGF